MIEQTTTTHTDMIENVGGGITRKHLPGGEVLWSIPNPSSALNGDALSNAIAAGDVEVIDRAIAQLQAIAAAWRFYGEMARGK